MKFSNQTAKRTNESKTQEFTESLLKFFVKTTKTNGSSLETNYVYIWAQFSVIIKEATQSSVQNELLNYTDLSKRREFHT